MCAHGTESHTTSYKKPNLPIHIWGDEGKFERKSINSLFIFVIVANRMHGVCTKSTFIISKQFHFRYRISPANENSRQQFLHVCEMKRNGMKREKKKLIHTCRKWIVMCASVRVCVCDVWLQWKNGWIQLKIVRQTFDSLAQ